ncbi:MAG: patatin-like phospholipase family protein [Pseudomonadota bacterium]
MLSGGGARGAYQVGVLKALAEAMPGPSPFPVITGVSVGAINAVVLAEGADDFPASVKKLEEIWRSIHCGSIFVSDPWPLIRRLMGWSSSFGLGWTGLKAPRSLLDASPLRELIKSHVDFDRIGTMVNEGPLEALAVTASSYCTGQSVTFFHAGPEHKEWSRSRRLGVLTDITVDHVMASAALPAVFQSRKLGHEWFGDGALRQTAPLSPAIHLGCDHLLLIAARDGVIDDVPQIGPDQPYPSLGFLGGQLLDIVFNDNLDADVERLKRVNGTLGVMMPERVPHTDLRLIGTHMVRPSADIRDLTGEHIDELPWSVKMVLGTIGAMREPWMLPSYLTFEPGYIGALIDLGYHDGKRDADVLRRFIGDAHQQHRAAL